jgi:VIT1/CCC1 family predicted Fe2+/Mn2+ transporter
LVIIGGLAELFSGAISMGLGAYLAAVTERDHYLSEEAREQEEVRTRPEDEKEEIYEIMEGYGLDRDATRPLVEQLASNAEQWVRVCHLLPSHSVMLNRYHSS